MGIALAHLKTKWADIGFRLSHLFSGVWKGLLIGGIAFSAAYGAELALQMSAGNAPMLRFYATSYNVTGNTLLERGSMFVLICVVGNIINVVMEDGIFRGLFLALASRFSFAKAMLFSSRCSAFGMESCRSSTSLRTNSRQEGR